MSRRFVENAIEHLRSNLLTKSMEFLKDIGFVKVKKGAEDR